MWFKVDDNLSNHPKARAAGLPAMGLWVVAGSHCGQYLTEGFVESWYVDTWPNGKKLAAQLVRAGLWETRPDGWQFHQFDERNPSKEKVEADREATRIRVEEWRRKKAEEKAIEDARNAVTNGVTNGVRNGSVTPSVTLPRPDPTRPDPIGSSKEGSGGGVSVGNAHDESPPPQCSKHPNGTDEPCGACKGVRQHQERSDGEDQMATQRAKSAAAARARDCLMCEGGWRLDSETPVKCTHDPVRSTA